MSVPNSFFGNQLARTGQAYAGFFAFSYNFDYREYIEAPLLSALLAGRRYCVEFYVNRADGRFGFGTMGAYFSNDTLSNTTLNEAISWVTPQVENPCGNTLASADDWMQVSGSFIAAGGEKFMTIGNFRTESNSCGVAQSSFGGNYGYFLVDDVSVYLCDTIDTIPPPDTASVIIPNVFTPNGDGVNDQFSITSTGIDQLHCTIYNRYGVKMAELSAVNAAWDGTTTSGQAASEGVYYYVLDAKGEDGKEISRKGFVQLVR